jgi:hypothetical protein
LIEGYSGGLGTDVVRAAEGVGKPSTINQPADVPIVGRLFGRNQDPAEKQKRLKWMADEEKQKVKVLAESGKREEATNRVKWWNQRYPDHKISMPSAKINWSQPGHAPKRPAPPKPHR